VILDAGSGLRPLGHDLMKQRNGTLTADILLSHTHWDHIQGLPFFKPLSSRQTSVTIYGAAQEGVPLKDILGRQMDPMVFPVPLNALAASLTVVEIGEGDFSLDDFRVCTFRLRHPGTTLGYRLAPAAGGREVAYVTDNELGPGGTYEVPPDWRARLVEFVEGADTLIHDAMYLDQIIQARAGWGHSTPRQAVDLAAEARCARLILFHHEPEHDDDALDRLLADTRQYAAGVAPRLVVEAAAEGMQFSL
jgi:phosphoribosyl 1,2-cyclic phosphodiesterase